MFVAAAALYDAFRSRPVNNSTASEIPVSGQSSFDGYGRPHVARFGYATLLSPFEDCLKNDPADRGISMAAGCSAGTVFVKSLMTT